MSVKLDIKEIAVEEINDINILNLEPIDIKIKNIKKLDVKCPKNNVERENSVLESSKKEQVNKEEEKQEEEKQEQVKKEEGNGKEIVVKNGWTVKKQSYFQICLHRLKYYRIINNFFFFELKKREGRLSWGIIVLSSFSSVISLINTDSNIFPNSAQLVKWSLVLITLVITLISAYIKKQQFIDRLNDIDRYLQKLNQTVEELNITFIMDPDKRENYDQFCDKYIPLIKSLCISPASFSPTEWKRTVYIITKYYPELITGAGTNEELIWPWYSILDIESLQKMPENKKRKETDFGKTVLNSIKPLELIKANMLRL